MLTLYHCISARSFRVLWMLEELRLPYELHMLAFPPRAHDKSFLELNPRGTVPLFIDGETRMTESAVRRRSHHCGAGRGLRAGRISPLRYGCDETRFLASASQRNGVCYGRRRLKVNKST
jgi:Glutathione S-transferase, N-terminal domain